MLRRFAALSHRRQQAALMVVAFAVLALAAPLNLIHGFLDREEGTTYLRYAHMAAPLNALLAPHQQYYGLFPNVMTLLGARVLPLSAAATFDAWGAILVHLFTIYTILCCERFRTVPARLLAFGVVLFGPGMSIVMIGCTQTQFAFAMQCVIVLISDPQQHRFSRTLSTLLGGLDGVVSCILTPFFLYRAWRTRNATAALQAIILSVCTVMQALVMHHALPFSNRSRVPVRPISVYVSSMTTHLLLLPFFTRLVYHPATLLGKASPFLWVLFACAGVVGFALLVRLVWPAGPLPRMLLFLGLFHAACALPGIQGTSFELWGGGERYFYVGGTAIGLALVLQWQERTASPLRQRVLTAMLGLMIFSGALDMARYWKANQSGPVWAEQLSAWRQDPVHTTLTANPDFWGGVRYYMAPQTTSIDAPFYIFDSNTSEDALKGLPQDWFGSNPTTQSAR